MSQYLQDLIKEGKIKRIESINDIASINVSNILLLHPVKKKLYVCSTRNPKTYIKTIFSKMKGKVSNEVIGNRFQPILQESVLSDWIIYQTLVNQFSFLNTELLCAELDYTEFKGNRSSLSFSLYKITSDRCPLIRWVYVPSYFNRGQILSRVKSSLKATRYSTASNRRMTELNPLWDKLRSDFLLTKKFTIERVEDPSFKNIDIGKIGTHVRNLNIQSLTQIRIN